jgi:hypothetical protein
MRLDTSSKFRRHYSVVLMSQPTSVESEDLELLVREQTWGQDSGSIQHPSVGIIYWTCEERAENRSLARKEKEMTERLRAVIQAVEQLSLAEQDALANQIASLLPTPPHPAGLAAVDFSVFADVPDDAVDVLDRMRHEAPPTPPYKEP